MCLNSILPQKEKDDILNNITEDHFITYKVVNVKKGQYFPVYRNELIPYSIETMEAYQQPICFDGGGMGSCYFYDSGFHLFKSKNDAKSLLCRLQTQEELVYNNPRKRRKYEVIEVTIKKSWITEIGTEWDSNKNKSNIVLVAEKATFPECQKTVKKSFFNLFSRKKK